MFDKTGRTTPTVYSNRAKNVKGGYKVIGDICYINISFKINVTSDGTSANTIFTGFPLPIDDNNFTQFFNVVSIRGNSVAIENN